VEVEPTSTGLFRKLDSDGLSRLEEVDDAQREVVLEQLPADEPAELPHALLEASKDPDRRTEVGGPPTGQVPKSDLSSQMPKQPGRRARSPALWVALAAGFAGAGGLATWRLTQASSRTVEPPLVVAPPIDAGVVETKGTLEIDSTPRGAIATVADHMLGPTPASALVSSGVKIHVKLELRGYQLYEDDLSVEPGKTVLLRPRLQQAAPILHVETTPPGAAVTLGSQILGTTPLTKPVAVAQGAELAITKPGFESVRLKVDLRAGEQTDVTRALKETPKFGVVTVIVSGAANWGYVWFKGRNLGQNYTMAGGTMEFHLPVGRQRLRITHPLAQPKDVIVDISEHAPARVNVPL
jgi:hypothetical protein